MHISTRIGKLATTICYFMLFLSIIISYNTIATSYEISIYTNTPPIFWLSIIISILIGLFLVIFEDDNETNWKLGFSLVFFCYILCLSLFIIRGYYAWTIGGDPSSHIGYVKTILNTGHFSEKLFYPITHILSAEIIEITGYNLIGLHKLLPLFFGILFVPFMYLFSSSLLKKKKEIYLATLLSCAFISGWYLNFTPNHLSNFYLPLVLMIIVKSYIDIQNRINWSILLVIMVFLIPPFHPVPTIFLIIFILGLNVPFKVLNKLKIDFIKENENRIKIKSRFTLTLLLFIFSVAWISSFLIWSSTIENLDTLITEGGNTHISSLVETISFASGYGYNVFEQVLKLEGGIIFLLILSLIGIYLIIKDNSFYPKKNILPLYGPLLIMGVFILISYFVNIGFGPLRQIIYLGLLGIIISGYTLNKLFELSKNTKFKIPLSLTTFLIIATIFINGIFILYPSPYVFATNPQTTISEIDSMQWLLNNKEFKIDITGITVQPGEFGDFLYGAEIRREKIRTYSTKLRPPYHFGYQNSSSLANYYSKDFYLVTNLKEKFIYKEIFPEMAKYRWYEKDFDSLNQDSGLVKVYNNGQMDLWLINSTK